MKFRELNIGDWFMMGGMPWERVDFPAWSDASIMCLNKEDFGHVYPQNNLDEEVEFLPRLDYLHSHFHKTDHNVFNEKVPLNDAPRGLPLKATAVHEIYARTRYDSNEVYVVIYSNDSARQGLTFPMPTKVVPWVRECLELHLDFEEWSCGKS